MPVNKIYEILDKAYTLIERKNWVGTVILLLVIGFLLIRDDKKEEAEYYRKELIRKDIESIRKDSICAEKDRQKDEKFALMQQEYINTLKGINTTIKTTVGEVKETNQQRTEVSHDVISKVMRNTEALQQATKQKKQQ